MDLESRVDFRTYTPFQVVEWLKKKLLKKAEGHQQFCEIVDLKPYIYYFKKIHK